MSEEKKKGGATPPEKKRRGAIPPEKKRRGEVLERGAIPSKKKGGGAENRGGGAENPSVGKAARGAADRAPSGGAENPSVGKAARGAADTAPSGGEKSKKERYVLLDSVRGFAVLNMIAYHAVWDLVRMFGVTWQWFNGPIAEVWQTFICCTFLLLSGFCFSLGRNKLRRGLIVLLSGVLVSVVSLIFMPNSRVIYGVLTMLGVCMLLGWLAEGLLRKINPYAGVLIATALFVLSFRLNEGVLAFWTLPRGIYRNALTAFFGFPPAGFLSSDYFSLFPWVFAFFAGYFLYRIFWRRQWLGVLKAPRIPPLEWVGRHALVVYLLHQPLLYFLFSLIF